MSRQTRKIEAFNDRIGPVPISRLDRVLWVVTGLFVLVVLADTYLRTPSAGAYLYLRALHWQLSRYSVAVAVGMFAVAFYIGIVKHGDVTPYFRRGAYVVVATMVFESLIGAALWVFIGARPGEDVHLIYGAATVLALPFFIFVEKTAEKRPAMGSYLWGFAILAGIIIRSISTGPA